MALTVKKIARLGEGRYHDERGLYLQVSAKGGKYWTFRYKRKGIEHFRLADTANHEVLSRLAPAG